MMKITDACIACGTCQSVCPVEAVEAGDQYKINPEICLECGTCQAACPVGAIEQE
jgi:ferredoxin